MPTVDLGPCECCGGCRFVESGYNSLQVVVNMNHAPFYVPGRPVSPTPGPSSGYFYATEAERQSFCSSLNGTYIYDFETSDNTYNPASGTARELGQFGGDTFNSSLTITVSCTRASAAIELTRVRQDFGPGGFFRLTKEFEISSDGTVSSSTLRTAEGSGAGRVEPSFITEQAGLWQGHWGTCDVFTNGASVDTDGDGVAEIYYGPTGSNSVLQVSLI